MRTSPVNNSLQPTPPSAARLSSVPSARQRMTDDELIAAIEQIRNTMIAVATGGPRIAEVNEEYRRVFAAVAADLARRHIGNPITYGSLWDWYGRWSSGDLPSYQSRRHARSALEFAVALQHRRTASFRDFALCVESTTTVINIAAITSGRRDPT